MISRTYETTLLQEHNFLLGLVLVAHGQIRVHDHEFELNGY